MGFISFDQKDENWDERIAEKADQPFVVHVLGNRFEICVFTRGGTDADDNASTRWFSGIVGSKPVIVQASSVGIVICNSKNIAIWTTPAPKLVLEELRKMDKFYAIESWGDRTAKNFTKIPARGDLVALIKDQSANSMAFIGQQGQATGTVAWAISTAIDALAIDAQGGLEQDVPCSECGLQVNISQLAGHYIASHFEPTDFARAEADGLWVCGVCGDERCSRDDLVPHLLVAHEARLIDMIVRTLPGAAATFGVKVSTAAFIVDPTGSFDTENSRFWRSLRIADRQLGKRTYGDGADIADLLIEVDRARRDGRRSG
jgi:hypothetical protein